MGRLPGVGAARQPRALVRNPFGICGGKGEGPRVNSGFRFSKGGAGMATKVHKGHKNGKRLCIEGHEAGWVIEAEAKRRSRARTPKARTPSVARIPSGALRSPLQAGSPDPAD
jgi:hypothetical protein